MATRDTGECDKLKHAVLNASSLTADGELLLIQETVTTEKQIEFGSDLTNWIGSLAQCPQGSTATKRSLDLVAHSNSDHHYLLQLGGWLIDATDPAASVIPVFENMKAALDKLKVSQLRLLGCYTAKTQESHDTISLLKKALGIEVLGTNDILYQSDFDALGFRDASDQKLQSLPDALPRPAWIPRKWPKGAQVVHPISLERLPNFAAGDLPNVPWPTRRLSKPLDLSPFVAPINGRALPGLLTLPSLELHFPVSQGFNRYSRLQVLFDYGMVRVYPNEAPNGDHNNPRISMNACYWVQKRGAFKSFLANLL